MASPPAEDSLCPAHSGILERLKDVEKDTAANGDKLDRILFWLFTTLGGVTVSLVLIIINMAKGATR